MKIHVCSDVGGRLASKHTIHIHLSIQFEAREDEDKYKSPTAPPPLDTHLMAYLAYSLCTCNINCTQVLKHPHTHTATHIHTHRHAGKAICINLCRTVGINANGTAINIMNYIFKNVAPQLRESQSMQSKWKWATKCHKYNCIYTGTRTNTLPVDCAEWQRARSNEASARGLSREA